MSENKKIKRSRIDVITDTAIYFILATGILLVVYPLYFVVIASFSDPFAVAGGDMIFFPVRPTVAGYKMIFDYRAIWTGYGNTIIYTLCSTALSLFLTLTIAYPLSVGRFSGRTPILIYLMITMYISGGLIPTFILVNNLGLTDTRMAVILLGSVGVFSIIITRTFLQTNIPSELEDAARIDGCSPIRFFITCVIPLSSAIIAVLTLWTAVGTWNDFFTALIYLRDARLYPLQLIVRAILFISTMPLGDQMDFEEQEMMRMAAEQIKYGVIIVSSVPLLMLYPFLQKFFIKGIMIGSIKG